LTQVAPHSHRSRRSAHAPTHGAPHQQQSPAQHPRRDTVAAPVTDSGGRGRHATTYGQNFGGVVLWTLVGSFVPGAGFMVSGRRALGWFVLVVNLVIVGGVAGAVWYAGLDGIVAFAAAPGRIVTAAIVVLVLVLFWALVVLGSHVSIRRYAHLTVPQRVLSSALVLAVIGVILVPAARAADYSLIYRSTAASIFGAEGAGDGKKPDAAKKDPWADVPRINVLLLGSDAGSNRTGIRTDTVILASIDTKSGRTVMFSLPRNLQGVPFPAGSRAAADYPSGYRCPDQSCMLNALWMFGENNWKTYYPKAASAREAGYTAVKEGVEQALGVTVDTYAMVDMKGLEQFINAIGGVTVNVEQDLAIGGAHDGSGRVLQYPVGYLKPGIQHLNGHYAQWYARSRFNTDDYDRMRRQRCLIGYTLDQSDPMTVLRAFPGIAKAAKSNIRIGIQVQDLAPWADLALRVQKGGVKSLTFTSKVISTGDPDFALMQEKVQEAITAPAPEPSPSASAGSPSPSKTKKPTKDGAEADETKANSLKDVCPPVG
jgi:polyisoprenyl-teichoic acid--peptidoglycan teichoic acid transferase